MIKKFHLVEPLNTDTAISTWNNSRRRINQTIEIFNKWQRDGFDDWTAQIVLAEVDLLHRTLGDLSEYYENLVSEMQNHVLDCIRNDEEE